MTKREIKELQDEKEAIAAKLQILLEGLGHALPLIEHRGTVRIKRGPDKGKLAHPPPKEVAKAIRELMARVLDYRLCNADCKWLYFCSLKRGHKGVHKDEGIWWCKDGCKCKFCRCDSKIKCNC